jgi:hypothetical protein
VTDVLVTAVPTLDLQESDDTDSTHDMDKGTRLGSRFEEHSAGSSEDIVGKR